jgi:hypothetical protein
MSNIYQRKAEPAMIKHLLLALLGAGTLFVAGCTSERDENDGQVFNTILLPTDVVLNLACENVGVHPETCVLEDPENPYAAVPISEFDPFNPEDPFNKLVLDDSIPKGPTGAKARFYLWATALATRPSGENQYFTALALHELFDANSNAIGDQGSVDELVRLQALKAYESTLFNFFGSAYARECRVVDGCNPPVNFFRQINELVADNLYRTEATGWRRLVPGLPNQAIALMLDWGFLYTPCTVQADGSCTGGVVSVGRF